MKTIRKSKEKKAIEGFLTLKVKDLMQIRGGDNAPITIKGHVL